MAEMKTLWHKSDEDADWHPVALHAIDASHAIEVDPEHWRQSKPESEVVEEKAIETEPQPEPEPNPETEQ